MKNKVFVYCRKSSEGEDKQMLSIPSQKSELVKLIKSFDLTPISEPFEESKSAKSPGREIFGEMTDRIEQGEASRILVWHVDRLSRNSVDTGKLIYLMDTKKIEEIITPSQVFKNTPNDKFLLNLLCSQAKLENDNRGINAKRGMNTKAEMGWWPQHAPIGYMNTPNKKKGFKTIEVDPERFHLVKKCFKEVINGKSAKKVYVEAIENWGLTSQTTGKPIAQSTFYKMLNNPFYFGEFFWNNKWYKGEHQAMINSDEFDVVQRMLGKKGKPVQRAHTFDLTGLFKCQQCGCGLTATKKVKYYKRTNNRAEYIYYHCTKKRRNMKCTQKPMKEEELTKKIIEQLQKVQPSIEFIEWAKKWVKFLHQNESQFQENVLDGSRRKLTQTDNRLNKLLDLYIDGNLDKDTYEGKKKNLELEKRKLERKVSDADNELSNWRVKVEDVLDFTEALTTKFVDGNRDKKHQILFKISSDLLYESKNPLIYLKEEYQSLKLIKNKKEKPTDVARTSKYADVFVERPDLIPTNSTWLPQQVTTRTNCLKREKVKRFVMG